ncbi:hypothetical protein [Acinetobacter haemolyticus]|uniref:hypothetical protein n=1 Tax=Acinetobacter haemolyticus TaxID=29430 RepID=UPI001331F7BF|nr:hypothetical protein [Acinetobacter haemolyticus]QHI17210.1 hypothetical protein AhaeAN4_11765 [Acinetobacter haemolyticus]
MTIAIPEFRQQTCVALIGAGITQQAQIISTVAALEKFVFSTDEYASKAENKNTVAEKTTSKKENAATETQKAAEVVEQPAATETTVAETTPNYTKDDVHKALVGVAQKHGRAALVTILSEVNAEKLTDVAESDYPKLMKLVEDYPA